MWGDMDTFSSGSGSFTGAGGGGGFMNTSMQSPSTAKGDKGGVKRTQSVVPVTIRQLLESSDDGVKIDDIDASTVTVVGVVRRVEISTTKVSYIMDDNTGTIEGITYVGADDVGSGKSPMTLLEGTYGRIVGAVRSQHGQKYLVVYKVFPITDLNEITCHGLEILQIPSKMKKIKEMEASKTGFGGFGMQNTFTSSMVGGGFGGSFNSGGSSSGFSKDEQALLKYMRQTANPSGIHRKEFERVLGMSTKQVTDAIDSLSGEGHVYTTLDDDHFGATDQ